jgi:deoxyadenosine/deoxycytidine kinase
MKGIIIEGVIGSGKSSVLRLLHQRLSTDRPNSNKFFISEHFTQRALEELIANNSLSQSIVKKHFKKILQPITNYQEILLNSKFANEPQNADLYFTIERFVLTMLNSIPSLQSKEFDKWLIKQLNLFKKNKIKQYILKLDDEIIYENLLSSLKYRNQNWIDFVNTKGGADKFSNDLITWQNNILLLADKYSRYIDTEIIDANQRNYHIIAEYIYSHSFK